MNAPIFIVGANRSGTTLLRLMLNAHPRIAVPDELAYFDSTLAGVPVESWRNPGLLPKEYESFVDHFIEKICQPLDGIGAPQLREKILSGPRNFKYPYQCALEAWARHHDKERWGEKTPGNLFYVDVIYEMFPDAQLIYVMRDPRGGVHSMLKTSLFRGGTIINALNRRKYMTSGLNHLKQSIPPRQRTVTRFEDLVQTPEATLHRLCEFLDEEYTPQMLSFHEDAEHYMTQRAVSQFNRTATEPVDSKKAEAWRQGLTDTQIAKVEWVCGAEMDAHDYEPETQTLSHLERCTSWLKAAYWHYQNWRHRHSPQFIYQDQIMERSRNRLRQALGYLHPLSKSLK